MNRFVCPFPEKDKKEKRRNYMRLTFKRGWALDRCVAKISRTGCTARRAMRHPRCRKAVCIKGFEPAISCACLHDFLGVALERRGASGQVATTLTTQQGAFRRYDKRLRRKCEALDATIMMRKLTLTFACSIAFRLFFGCFPMFSHVSETVYLEPIFETRHYRVTVPGS